MLITIKNWLNFTNALLKGVCRFTQLIIVGDVFNKCTHWSCRAMQDHWHVSENKANTRICYWKCCNILLLSFFIWTDGIFIQWEDKKKEGGRMCCSPSFPVTGTLGYAHPCVFPGVFVSGGASTNELLLLACHRACSQLCFSWEMWAVEMVLNITPLSWEIDKFCLPVASQWVVACSRSSLMEKSLSGCQDGSQSNSYQKNSSCLLLLNVLWEGALC